MKAKGIHDKRSPPIGFDEWNLDALDVKLKELIRDALIEGFAIATQDYQCHAWFPIEWDTGDGADGIDREGVVLPDPTTIYVNLPLGAEEYENPRWSFQLTELVESMIELHEAGEGGPISEDAHPSFIAVRNRLRELADMLDAALKRK